MSGLLHEDVFQMESVFREQQLRQLLGCEAISSKSAYRNAEGEPDCRYTQAYAAALSCVT